MTVTLDHTELDEAPDTLDLNLDVTLFADGVFEQDGDGVTMAWPWVTNNCVTRYVCSWTCPSRSCY